MPNATTSNPTFCYDTSATGILRALPESNLLVTMRDRFAVDVAQIRQMQPLQRLLMAEACRFLSNNLPIADANSQ